MKTFTYYAAESHAAAAKALASMPGAVAKAGGTDLLDLLKSRIVTPDAVVKLPAAPAPAGTLAASATLASVAADARLRAECPAVAQAAAEAATPQIRNVATVGGNLCQTTRCWYLRTPGFDCYKLGSGGCAMRKPKAESRYGAVLGHDHCGCAHPSNLAPALIAVDARVALTHPEGNREIAAADLYRPPLRGSLSDTVLRPGELITHVILPASPLAKRSAYVEMRDRDSFDFACVSVAVGLHVDGGTVKASRVCFGAVAPIPVRDAGAEAALTSKALSGETIAAAAAAALAGAQPLEQNAYKLPVARGLLRRALEGLA